MEEEKTEAAIIEASNTDKLSEEQHKIAEPQPKPLKDSIIIYVAIALVLLTLMIVFIPKLIPHIQPNLDNLFQQNLEGKLSPDKGYLYNGVYNFVLFDNLWYTQLKTPSNTKLFNIPFHYSPKDVEQIAPIGYLNKSGLDNFQNFFITFDPNDENLNFIGVAVGEADQILISVFGKGVIAACTHNDSAACEKRPIVDCNSSNEFPVIYFASENQTSLLYLNNCIIISGDKYELLKATDRMLFDLLGIIK